MPSTYLNELFQLLSEIGIDIPILQRGEMMLQNAKRIARSHSLCPYQNSNSSLTGSKASDLNH